VPHGPFDAVFPGNLFAKRKKKKDQKIAGKKKDENEKSFQPKHYPNHLLQTGTENRSLGI
jgi:hypothetical protein